jgi:periplasmic divalent cation tolerance protein
VSPYPMDPVDATGPMRLVITAMPDTPASAVIVRNALDRRLAACAQAGPVQSVYWWKDRVEIAAERVVVFKTTPKLVGALFRFLAEAHPYEVPEIIEVDVARAHGPYLEYLAGTLDAFAPPPPLGGGSAHALRSRRGARRARGARPPGRTRAPRRRR